MFKLLKIEFLKLKHAMVLTTATICPLFAVMLGSIDLLSAVAERGNDVLQWSNLIYYIGLYFSVIVYVMCITIVLAMTGRIEHANNGWKHILSLPVRRGNIYFTKLIVGVTVITYCVLILWLGTIVTGKIIGVDGPIPFELVKTSLFSYYSALPIIAIQFYLSFSFNHIGIPLAVGTALTFPVLLILNSKYWIYYPWTYPFAVFNTRFFQHAPMELLKFICPVSFIFIVLAGYIQFKGRDIL